MKGKRVLITILSKLYQCGQLPKEVFIYIFDTKNWTIERVQNYACKRYMCVSLNVNNDAILGDCGRYPVFIECVKRSISYWLKLLKMRDNKYARKCHNMMKHYDQLAYDNWVSQIRRTLYLHGFGYIWEQQEVTNVRYFLSEFQQRPKYQYLQLWLVRARRNEKEMKNETSNKL